MNCNTRAARVSSTSASLVVEWADGSVDEFASLWLRDNRPEDRDPHNGQRLIDIAELPPDPRLRSATVADGRVLITWEGEPRPISYDCGWLAAHVPARRASRPEREVRLWLEGARLDAHRDFAWAELAGIRESAAARREWLVRLLQDGIAFIAGVPATDTAILDVGALLGRVCETNYGLVFDVRSVPQPENLAYSDLGLGLHTDNPYREPVPGFQVLHALAASREGGDSLFADGFAIGEHLRGTAPQAFARLTTTPVPFLYQSQDAELYAERPLIRLSCDGAIAAVHYNNRSIAPLRLPAGELAAFYAAYRCLARALREARFQLRLRLNDSELVVFDNQRTLHGRTGFSSARYPRHLRGCYLTRDSVYSEAALLLRRTGREADR